MFKGRTDGIEYRFTAEGSTLILEYENQRRAIPVKKAAGFSWKVNKKSVSCGSGNAADIIKVFNNYDAYANATFNAFR